MAFTTTQLEALEAAIATGTRQVMYGNKLVMYQSLDEMLRLRDVMRKELGLLKPNAGRTVGEFNKGLK
jgi:hypothetical protein